MLRSKGVKFTPITLFWMFIEINRWQLPATLEEILGIWARTPHSNFEKSNSGPYQSFLLYKKYTWECKNYYKIYYAEFILFYKIATQSFNYLIKNVKISELFSWLRSPFVHKIKLCSTLLKWSCKLIDSLVLELAVLQQDVEEKSAELGDTPNAIIWIFKL